MSNVVMMNFSYDVPVKIYPADYRRVVETREQMKGRGLSDSEVVMAAFQVNARDKARADGR